MIVRTESGSRYEIDHGAKVLRRLNANLGSSTRVGAGEWKPFELCPEPILGLPVLIIWRVLDDGTHQVTLTSSVVEIEDEQRLRSDDCTNH